MSVFLAVRFWKPKECKRARYQKGVGIFLFGPFRHLSDFVVHVIKAKRKRCYFIRSSFLQANCKNKHPKMADNFKCVYSMCLVT